ADLLRQARVRAGPPSGGAARGSAAGALAVQPLQRCGLGEETPQRGAREDGRTALHLGRPGGSREGVVTGATAWLLLLAAPRELLLRIRAQTADRPLRSTHGRSRRPEGAHDDRPAPAAARAQSDRRNAERARRPGGGARDGQPGER